MDDLKLAIIYYSSTGTNHQMAKWAEEAGRQAGASEVRLRRLQEIAPKEAIQQNEDWEKHLEATKNITTASLDDLEWADAIVFSIPTRYGNFPSQLGAFIDTTGGLWSKGKLANKVVSGMTSAQNIHGGQETTLLSLYKTMHHWGAIVVAPGYTDEVLSKAGGNPYGVSVSAGKDNLTDDVKKAIHHQVKRTVSIANWIKKGISQK
jgi:NAD(P)H dehydrogenase (quinone)